MKLGLGLYRDLLNAPNLRFAKQSGVTHIVAHIPGGFASNGDRIITSDRAAEGFGVSHADDPIWTYRGLSELKALVEAEGLTLAAMENFAPVHWYDVLLNGPLRDAQIARLQQLIRDMGRVGIPVLGYYFSIAGTWGRVEGPFARGGASSVGFLDPPQTPIANGMVWNMVYAPEQFDPSGALGVVAPVSASQIWERYTTFLADLLPVAEEAGVTLALHADDPPLPELRGTSRLVYDADGYQRVLDLSPSPRHAMEFCVGTLSEMPGADIYEMVDRYSRTHRIAYVHVRNVRGKAPHYYETFIDDGDTDMLRVLSSLHRNAFDGVVIPDHTPLIECSAPWHAGKAYALGYLRAALQVVTQTGAFFA